MNQSTQHTPIKSKLKRSFFYLTVLCFTFSISMAQQSGIKPVKTGRTVSKKGNNAPASINNQGIGNTTPTNFKSCATDNLMKKYIVENHLEAVYEQEKLNKQNISSEIDNDRTVKIIPVVFHVVYNPNITASAQANAAITQTVIDNAIARLNADFSKTTTTGVRSAFHSLISNTNIQFCLANRNASGAVASGITRSTTSQTYFDDNSSSPVNGSDAMKTASYGIVGWDHLKYVNIWLCDISNNMTLCTNGCTAGYAYLGSTSQSTLPNMQGGIMIDGIVLDYNVGLFENPQTSDLSISKSISHEMGHYLGLEHTFADNTNGCVNDDGFTDTPPVKGPFQSFYYCSQGTTVQSCSAGTLWQYENLMDYSDCFVMFTPMQSNYMNSVLTNGRYGLANWQATGCTSSVTITPVASFSGCNSNVSQNSSVTLTSTSTNSPTSWLWAITPSTGVSYAGGTSSASQNPQITFANTGTYSVSLTATNSAGSNTFTSASCITVVAGNSSAGCDTILNITSDDNLIVYNSNNWGYISGMNGYNDQAKAEKYMSSSYTYGNDIVGAYVYFYKYVYASAASNVNLKVWNASGTGGSPGATAIATKNVLLNSIPSTGLYPGIAYIPFSSPVPISGDFYVGVEFTSPYVLGDTVALVTNSDGESPTPGTSWEKYNNVWTTAYDNWGINTSLYIAPVFCSITTDIEASDVDNFSVYPNPSNGIVSVMVGLNKNSDIKVFVYNSLGQLIKTADMESGYGGKVDFNLFDTNDGLYFIRLQTGTSVTTKRVVLTK
ncbi:MAG: M43 family zinc metalloprotease [Bacteroidota bacterium]